MSKKENFLKIANITPGLLPIPPNGWGAVEKIIWETHLNLQKLGHHSEIRYLNEVDDSFDVVHIHVANLAIEAHRRGIKYFFTMHDHHSFLYGKDSEVYKQNLEAIVRAEKAFVPAKFLIEYFGNPPNLFYFSHGVNNKEFTPNFLDKQQSILCVANNGFIHDQSEDRKGFGIAIEAAQKLDLPITIAGPENNRKFFEKNTYSYDKLTVLYNLSEDDLKSLYRQHTIFLHASVLEAGHPNLTLLEAMASGLPVVATFEENNELPGLIKITRSIESAVSGILVAIKNYEDYRYKAIRTANMLNWGKRTQELISHYLKKKQMKELLEEIYTKTQIATLSRREPTLLASINYIKGCFLEIRGSFDKKYQVKFIDKKTGQIEYQVEMGNNTWAKTNREFYVDRNIEVFDGNKTVNYGTDFSEKRVFVSLDSKSIGDTIAWVPIAEEFRKKHNCHLVLSTFHNDWFELVYPEIEFVSPGSIVHNIIAQYTIGLWYSDKGYDPNKHPRNPFERSLQGVCSDILGLEEREIRPKIHLEDMPPAIEGEYICIAPQSTAQSKYWNYPGGWQKIVDHYNSLGYKVIYVSHENPNSDYSVSRIGAKLHGIVDRSGLDIKTIMNDIRHCKTFVGLSSGLSWISWALGANIVLVSGFTDSKIEFSDCERIINEDVCHGCWSRHQFDRGDWNWCPDHKGTHRQFECTKSIGPERVIFAIDKLLNNNK